MIVELYVAAPGAGTYHYVTFTIGKPMRVTHLNMGNDDPSLYAQLWIYRGTVNGYAAANNFKAVYLQRMIQAAGASYPAYPSYWNQSTNFILPEGTYTFACRVSVAQTHLKFVLFLEDV